MPKNDFKAALERFADKVEEASLSAFQATATGAHAVADSLTPVLTGKTRANNQVAINTAAMDEINELDPSGSAARSRAASVAQSLKLGDTAVIGNPLDHVEGLEGGSSKKSPGGMYAMAREEAPGVFQREFMAGFR